MPRSTKPSVATMGVDIDVSSFSRRRPHQPGAIGVRQRRTRSQIGTRLTNLPPYLIGMEACVGAHHLQRGLHSLGHNARRMPAKYLKAY